MRENIRTRKEEEEDEEEEEQKERGPGNNKVLEMKLTIMVKCSTEIQKHRTVAAAAVEVLSGDTGLSPFTLRRCRVAVSPVSSWPAPQRSMAAQQVPPIHSYI